MSAQGMPSRVEARPDGWTLAAFAAVVVCGGANAIAVKISVAELAPLWSAALRFAVAGALLVGVVLASRRSLPRGASLAGAILYGAIAFSGSFALIYPALRNVPAGSAMILISLVPLLTLGLAILHRQERFRIQGLLGALIALAGVGIVVADQLSLDIPLAPLVAIILGAGFIAEGGVLLKWLPRADPFATNAVAMLVGAAILGTLSVGIGEPILLPARAETWAAMAYLVVFGSIALFALWLFAVRRWTASAVSYSTLLMPLIAIPGAAIAFSEPVSVLLLLGGAIAMAGVYLGAFARLGPHESAAVSQPECLPVAAEPARPGA